MYQTMMAQRQCEQLSEYRQSRLPKILAVGSNINLVGVRIKQGSAQYGNSEFEIHGDEGTSLDISNSGVEPDVPSPSN